MVLPESHRLEILHQLGSGSYGTVYAAWDKERQRTVALKILHTHFDPHTLLRFKAEFRALADISHPNLVTLYDLICEDERWMLTMELLDGTHFRAWVREDDVCHLIRLREGLRQLGNGLNALHDAGILHRDIKPSNVLITEEGRLVLIDFGMAVETNEAGAHQSRHVMGTPHYMAPEQATGQTVTAASDWYSVGVLMYECMTGELPYRGSLFEVLTAKVNPPSEEVLGALTGCPTDLSQLCKDLIRLEPSTRPSGETVMKRLGNTLNMLPSAPPALPRLIGRDAVLNTLREALEEAETRAVVIGMHGPSGMGKTAVLTHFAASTATRPHTIVLRGRCYEAEDVPYKAFDQVVDALTTWLQAQPHAQIDGYLPLDFLALTRIFPVLLDIPTPEVRRRDVETADVSVLRRRACLALRELFARIAQKAQLVIVIDDLQWSDDESMGLFDVLLEPGEAPPFLLLAAWRTDTGKRFTLQGARELPLERLEPDAARTLAQTLMDGRGGDLDALVAEAQGHPYLLTELARLPQRDEGLTLDGALHRRIQRLPAPSRRVLEVLAVAGRPLNRDLALHAAGQAGEMSGVLALLRTQHLTRSVERSSVIATYHDRIRETVLAHLDEVQLRTHHHALAVALDHNAEADAEALVLHYRAAGDLEQARKKAVLAAAQAEETLAFDRAARLYAFALEEAETHDLRVKLANALANAGRGAEAAPHYQKAAQQVGDAAALDLSRRAAHEYLCSGAIAEGLDVLRHLLQKLGLRLSATASEALPRMLLGRLKLTLRGIRYKERAESAIPPLELQKIDAAWSGVMGISMVDTVRGGEMQVQHMDLALRCGEPRRIARALAWDAGFYCAMNFSDALAHARIRACRELLARFNDRQLSGLSLHLIGAGYFCMGEHQMAMRVLEEAADHLKTCPGVFFSYANACFFRMFASFYAGELADLPRTLREQMAYARDHGDMHAEVNLGTRALGLVNLLEDRASQTLTHLAHVLDGWPAVGFQTPNWYRWVAEIEALLYLGRADEAWQLLERHQAEVDRSQLLVVQIIRIITTELRGRVALARGDRKTVSKMAARLLRERRPMATGMGLLLQPTHAKLTTARQAFLSCNMKLHAAVADHMLGHDATAWLAEQGVVAPARLLACLAPAIDATAPVC